MYLMCFFVFQFEWYLSSLITKIQEKFSANKIFKIYNNTVQQNFSLKKTQEQTDVH